MPTNVVRMAGYTVRMCDTNSYELKSWYMLDDGGRMHDAVYGPLSWTELVDVMLSDLDDHRPGWGLGLGFRQPPLPFDQDQPTDGD